MSVLPNVPNSGAPSKFSEKLNVKAFAERFRSEMVPLGGRISFFSAGLRLNEDDEKEFIHDPVESLPPMVRELLPDTSIVLVPHLMGTSKKPSRDAEQIEVLMDVPKDAKNRIWESETQVEGNLVLTFAVQGCDSGEYHYRLFHAIAGKVLEKAPAQLWKGFEDLLRAELKRHVHGEVDDDSWKAKEELLLRSSTPWRESKQFRSYLRFSLLDSLTLYLHGLCCDIDVEPGPRQIQSRELKKRLEWLFATVGAPKGYNIFPETPGAKANDRLLAP